MDRTSILVIVVCFILFISWYPLMNRLYPPVPAPQTTNSLTSTGALTSASRTATNPPPPGALPGGAPQLQPAPPPVVERPTQPEELLVMENENARYVFTSHGGGLKLVELKEYEAEVGNLRPRRSASTNLATLNAPAPSPVMALLGASPLQGDNLYRLSRIANGIRAEKTLTNGLRLIKDFQLSTNYLLQVRVRMENQTNQPLAIPYQEWSAGTSTPINPQDHNTLMMGAISYNGRKAEHIGDAWFANRTLGCLPGTPRSEFISDTNVVWSAVHNQFFTIAIIPSQPAPRMLVRKINLLPASPSFWTNRPQAEIIGFQSSLAYPEAVLAAGQAHEQQFHIYVGPKEYNYLAQLGAYFKNDLDLIMDFGGFFGFFAKILLLSMNGLHALGLTYGLAIIAITIIIKLLFWPLTNASTRSMKRMAALQPQMKEIQEKYKDDPRKMNAKLMEFMKKNKVSPMSGCFPMLLQIPVFFGFYKMLQSAIELRGANFLWARDLSSPDTVWVIPGIDFPVNPLPLIMGATMLWQAQMTPLSPGMDPMQQKIMKYMPLMFMVFLYNFSAGLTLYWTVQNLLTIAQMKMTKNAPDPVVGHPAPVTVVPARPVRKKKAG